MARLRIEFSGTDGAREKERFHKELTDNGIGWLNVGHPTLVDLLPDELDHSACLALRSCLEHRSNWSGVGPICGYDERHGSTVATYARAVRLNENHVWKCVAAGCGWQESIQGSGFMALMDWNNKIQRVVNAIEQRKRENPLSTSSISGRAAARADHIWLEALKESQRYFNKNMDQFSNVNEAMSHMRQGGQVQVPEAMLGVDYSYIEHRVLEILRHSLQTGEELVVAMKDKVHEPMKHVLPLEYFEAKKLELRGAAKNASFSEALGVYKPWENIKTLRKRLAELQDMPKEDRYRAIYGGMTEHEKNKKVDWNNPNPVGQIPRHTERRRFHMPIQGTASDVLTSATKMLEEMHRRGVIIDEEKIAELERKVAIDTETHDGMVAYNPAYDMKVLEGMAIGVDHGSGDWAEAAIITTVFPELNKKLEDKVAELEVLKRIIEEQNKDLDTFRKLQRDKHWLHDEHIKLLDDVFMFFAGLNLQDHAVAEQRRYLELMRKFKTLMLDLKEAAKIT